MFPISKKQKIISDVISVFDISTCGIVDLGVIVWFCNFMFVIIFIGVVYSCYGGRVSAFVNSFFGLVCRIVEGSKMSIIGGGRLMLRSLFLLLLLCNIRGLIPFVARSSSHLVFRLSFGFSF